MCRWQQLQAAFAFRHSHDRSECCSLRTRVLVGVKEDNHGPCRYVPAFRSLGSVQWTGVLCINSLGRSDVRRTEIALWENSEYPA